MYSLSVGWFRGQWHYGENTLLDTGTSIRTKGRASSPDTEEEDTVLSILANFWDHCDSRRVANHRRYR